MKPDEIKKIVELTISKENKHYWKYVLLSVGLALLTTFTTQYFSEKGKNYATKQDIKILTTKVEEVKSEYAKQMEYFKDGQKIKFEKSKTLYDKISNLKYFLLDIKNTSRPKQKKLIKLFDDTRDVIFYINSDAILSKTVESEKNLLLDEYNTWSKILDGILNGEREITEIQVDNSLKLIDSMQVKILRFEPN